MVNQCAIPVFEGLLPKKHDDIVQDLLFELATWHGLAKLRLHTESTITDLENSATRLGTLLRKFKADVCCAYDTRDLPSEEAARGRREAAKAKKAAQTSATAPPPPPALPATVAKKNVRRDFNMETYKLHALFDYAASIRVFGTTDNTSSQVVSSN